MRRIPRFVLPALCAAAFAPLLPGSARADEGRNLIVIGWDRADPRTIRGLMEQGRMPRLKELAGRGSWVDIGIEEGPMGGLVGWSQILTGYNTGMMGIIDETHFQPIPRGFTLFERIKERLGGAGIGTALIGGSGGSLRPWAGASATALDIEGATAPPPAGASPEGAKPATPAEGDPFRNAADALDAYETDAGSKTLESSLRALDGFGSRRFFAVFHFREPAEQFFRHGPFSPQYRDALDGLDADLGRLEDKLAERGLRETTVLLVTTDMGAAMRREGTEPAAERGGRPRSPGPAFLACSLPGLRDSGDRRDIAPTVLDLFGLEPQAFRPALLGTSLLASSTAAVPSGPALPTVRIGFFLGGRTSMMYRTLLADGYRGEGVETQLLTRRLREDRYVPIEKFYGKYRDYLGKATGTELIDGVVAGTFDGATIGEASFIEAALQGKPVVAVAELGHDTREMPGHGIVLRKGIEIRTPADFKGLRLVARRSSGGDLVLLREFLVQKGLDPDKDVTILNNVFEDELTEGVESGSIDGGYFHLGTLRRLVKRGLVYVYEPLDWVNPELSHSLLIFSKAYLAAHPENVEKVLRAYMKRIRYEASLPDSERRKAQLVSLVMETNFNGLNFPQYERTPRVRSSLLDEMQDLLLRHHAIDRKADLAPRIDNGFVERVGKSLDSNP